MNQIASHTELQGLAKHVFDLVFSSDSKSLRAFQTSAEENRAAAVKAVPALLELKTTADILSDGLSQIQSANDSDELKAASQSMGSMRQLAATLAKDYKTGVWTPPRRQVRLN